MLEFFILGDGVDEVLLELFDLSFEVLEASFDAANDGLIDGVFEAIAFGHVHGDELVLAGHEGLEFPGLVVEELS